MLICDNKLNRQLKNLVLLSLFHILNDTEVRDFSLNENATTRGGIYAENALSLF